MNNAVDSINDIVSQVGNAARIHREEYKAKHSPSAWRKIWHDELKKYYPAYTLAYSDAVGANLQRAIKSRGLPIQDIGRMIAWIVQNWTLLRRTVFSFNPKSLRGPEAPDMGIIIKFLPQIYGRFNADKPEHALTLRAAHTAPEPSQANPLQPPPQPRPAPVIMRGNPALIRPVKIDYAKAEAARQRLGLRKFGE